jgi:2-iminobutanoate/2-iminopropanoate deaminase
MKKIIATDCAPPAVGPYSQAISAGDLVFCSGQIGIDPLTGRIAAGAREQTTQCIMNLRAVLEATGLSLMDVVKTTVFLTDINDFAEVNAAYAVLFTGEPPARSAVAVTSLPKGARVEIEAIALRCS